VGQSPPFLVWPLVTCPTSRLSHFPRLPPHRTPNVPSRYLHSTSGYDTTCPTPLHRPRIPLCAVHVRPAIPASWCGISDPPYAIRISEFGNRDSGTGDSGNHGAVEWANPPPPQATPRPPHPGIFVSKRPIPPNRKLMRTHHSDALAPPSCSSNRYPPSTTTTTNTGTSQSVGGSQ
jgi:hypothetical protein